VTDARLESTIADSPIDVVHGPFYVIGLPPGAEVPLGTVCAFWDDVETTVIAGPSADAGARDRDPEAVGPFALLRLRVARPFTAPGFIAAATAVLADAGISVYMVSTFSFDCILVRSESVEHAMAALTGRGFPLGEVTDAWE
jgi:hypothetical protein